ncbi:pre-16S rRNA nuclease, Ribonuclease H-like domain protein [Artemisia annua]|uniref:Pre-16S rRNA nuclease, Ribonuclease H-like domain protein n=1 Tax=Artemisia annua TaxID=35608 RepID=A0A2U1LJP2_ARTAN|nr:pre-16S rRNA nuclease, Ribonuclease H-like domain protein [Artemisia annua]
MEKNKMIEETVVECIHRRRWNERTPNNRILTVSEKPDRMATQRGELKLALSFNDWFRVTTTEEIMTRKGDLKLRSSFNDRLSNVARWAGWAFGRCAKTMIFSMGTVYICDSFFGCKRFTHKRFSIGVDELFPCLMNSSVQCCCLIEASTKGWRVYLQDEHGSSTDAMNQVAKSVGLWVNKDGAANDLSDSGERFEMVLPKQLNLQEKLRKVPPHDDLDFF